MKIVIVGAGIAGLSSYLFLHKHLVSINNGDSDKSPPAILIYEAYDVGSMRYDAQRGHSNEPQSSQEEARASDDTLPAPTTKIIGTAIGIGKNGLAVLGRMDESGEVLQKIHTLGNRISKWRIGTARGWKIADANVQNRVREEDSDKTGTIDTIMIARQVVWEVLRDQVLAIDHHAIVKKRIKSLETIFENGKLRTTLNFSDGTGDAADIVIGADGLRSIVRQTIFNDYNQLHHQSWLNSLMQRYPPKKDYVTPNYEGLTGLGGFVPGHILEGTGYDQDAMAITFGPNGFFGYGNIGSVGHVATDSSQKDSTPLAAWWSTFSSSTPNPYQKTIADNSPDSSTGIKTDFDRISALEELLARHKKWVDPSISAILRYVTENQAIEHIYPTYTTPELPTWKSKSSNVVLIGDAAHALQPSSGQGACQALEDAEALALLLKYYLHPHREVLKTKTEAAAVEMALSKLEELRMPRIAEIYKQSQRMSSGKMDMGMVKEYMMYFFIWMGTRMGFMEKYNEQLFGYDLPKEVERIVAGAA